MTIRCFALADASSFYTSCEAIFNPSLGKQPTIVLSNNDGNVVARSKLAKKLIPMGAPLHTIQHVIREHDVAVFSMNPPLYADVSRRLHDCLSIFTHQLDIYSCDEAFADWSFVEAGERERYGREMRAVVRRHVGLFVNVGIAATKQLTKVAIEQAKQRPSGVYELADEAQIDAILKTMPVEELWGVNVRRGEALRKLKIATAYDLKCADPARIRRQMTVVVERIVWELRGVACIDMVERTRRKQICSARAFGRSVRDLGELKESVALHVVRAVEKLHEQGSNTRSLTVFIATNPFDQTDRQQYSRSATITLPQATNSVQELIANAHAAVERIFKPGISYHRSGIMLGDLSDAATVQPTLFPIATDGRQERIEMVIREINARFGRDTIRYLATGLERPWLTRAKHRSQRYTTQWGELVQVH